jgi:hypothetical protein
MHVEQSRIWKEAFVACFEPLFWHKSVYDEAQNSLSSATNGSVVLQVLVLPVALSTEPFRSGVTSAACRQRCCAIATSTSSRLFSVHSLCLFRHSGLGLTGPLWFHRAPPDVARPRRCDRRTAPCHHSATKLYSLSPINGVSRNKRRATASTSERWHWSESSRCGLPLYRMFVMSCGWQMADFHQSSLISRLHWTINVTYGCLAFFTEAMQREKVRIAPLDWTFQTLHSPITGTYVFVWFLQYTASICINKINRMFFLS